MSFVVKMDYISPIQPYLGLDPLSLVDVALENAFPEQRLLSIAGQPGYIGQQRIGETVTDRDTILKQDVRLSNKIILDAVGPPNDPTDKTWWISPCVLYRGSKTFSMTELILPSACLDKCTATSELSAMGMYKITREYAGHMFGGSIDFSAEVIQKCADDNVLQQSWNLKCLQLSNSTQMTFREDIYKRMMAGPTLDYVEFRKKVNRDRVNKSDLFYSHSQKAIDMFCPWNFRRTDTLAVLVDLDNSLKFDGTLADKKDADTYVMHPVMINRLMDRLVMANPENAKRQVYYKCVNSVRKELSEKDIEELKGAEYDESPMYAINVNGSWKYVVAAPNVTVDDDRSNPARLTVTFNSFVVIGCNPSRSTTKRIDFETVKDVDWNSIWITDLERGADAHVKLIDVVTKSGYLDEETYDSAQYNQLLACDASLLNLRDKVSPQQFYATVERPYDGNDDTSRFRPSRKVYFDPEKKTYEASLTYGHSDVDTSPVDNGDVLSAMTIMSAVLAPNEKFALGTTYLNGCMELKWTETDVQILKTFYETDFKDLLDSGNDNEVRAYMLEDVKKNDGFTHFINYDQLLMLQSVITEAFLKVHNPSESTSLKHASAGVDLIFSRIDELLEAYYKLVASCDNYTHTWFFTMPGKCTLQRLFTGVTEPHDEYFTKISQYAVIYHRIILRLLSPRVVAVDLVNVSEIDEAYFHSIPGHHDRCFNAIRCHYTFVTKTTSYIPKAELTVISKLSPYHSWVVPPRDTSALNNYSINSDFVNFNYSYRVHRIAQLESQTFAVRSYALLFISFLQNPTTTRMLISKNVSINTAFMLSRAVTVRTASIAMLRTGLNHRAYFVGNGIVTSTETNTAAYKADLRVEGVYVDRNPIDNTRTQHNVCCLGYVRGMGSGIYDPDKRTGDFIAIPLPSSYDPVENSSIQSINGRFSGTDGNHASMVAEDDEITASYSSNPFAVFGNSEAHITFGQKNHKFWGLDYDPGEGVYTLLTKAKNPQYFNRQGFHDDLIRPIVLQHGASPITVQGRQYVEGSQSNPAVFKTRNLGYLGINEHSDSSFKDSLDISTVRCDQGLLQVDPDTCKPSREAPIATGLLKSHAPLRQEPSGRRLVL